MKKGQLQRSKSWAPSNCQTNSIPASCRSAAVQPAGVGFYRAKRRTKPRGRDLLEAAHALLNDSKGGLRQTVRNTLAPLSQSAFARSLRPARRCATSPLRDVGHCTRRATRRQAVVLASLQRLLVLRREFQGPMGPPHCGACRSKFAILAISARKIAQRNVCREKTGGTRWSRTGDRYISK